MSTQPQKTSSLLIPIFFGALGVALIVAGFYRHHAGQDNYSGGWKNPVMEWYQDVMAGSVLIIGALWAYSRRSK
jgi:hypothetical protein